MQAVMPGMWSYRDMFRWSPDRGSGAAPGAPLLPTLRQEQPRAQQTDETEDDR